MSRMLSKMNLISVVQQLSKEDIETIQSYIKMIEEENKKLIQECTDLQLENTQLNKMLNKYKKRYKKRDEE